MKKAFIVVGSHWYGKSFVINCFFKPLVGIESTQHTFWLNGKKGYIYSQSFEEKQGWEEKHIEDLIAGMSEQYEYTVFVARPKSEPVSYFNTLENSLKKYGYKVESHEIKEKIVDYQKDEQTKKSEEQCKTIAKEMYNYFSK